MRRLFAGAAISALAMTTPVNARPVYLSCSYMTEGRSWNYELTVKPESETGLIYDSQNGTSIKAAQFITASTYTLKYVEYIGESPLKFFFEVDRTNGVFVRRMNAPSLSKDLVYEGSCRKSQPKQVLF